MTTLIVSTSLCLSYRHVEEFDPNEEYVTAEENIHDSAYYVVDYLAGDQVSRTVANDVRLTLTFTTSGNHVIQRKYFCARMTQTHLKSHFLLDDGPRSNPSRWHSIA